MVYLTLLLSILAPRNVTPYKMLGTYCLLMVGTQVHSTTSARSTDNTADTVQVHPTPKLGPSASQSGWRPNAAIAYSLAGGSQRGTSSSPSVFNRGWGPPSKHYASVAKLEVSEATSCFSQCDTQLTHAYASSFRTTALTDYIYANVTRP